jgi:hypothetical protein
MPRTKIRGGQISLNEIFSVERILAARGFTVSQQGSLKETLIDADEPNESNITRFFESFDSTKKRENMLNSLTINGGNYQERRKQYSNTLEWYIGELLVRKFQAFSSAFGIKARNIIRPTLSEMGDFDVLAVLGDMSLFYAECKSGEISYNQVEKAIERGLLLGTAATIIVYEKAQDIISLLKDRDYPGIGYVCRINKIEISKLGDSDVLMWHDVFFLNTNRGLENKIQTILRLVAQRKNGFMQVFGADIEYLSARGFSIAHDV